jgi:hypothetical protein
VLSINTGDGPGGIIDGWITGNVPPQRLTAPQSGTEIVRPISVSRPSLRQGQLERRAKRQAIPPRRPASHAPVLHLEQHLRNVMTAVGLVYAASA